MGSEVRDWPSQNGVFGFDGKGTAYAPGRHHILCLGYCSVQARTDNFVYRARQKCVTVHLVRTHLFRNATTMFSKHLSCSVCERNNSKQHASNGSNGLADQWLRGSKSPATTYIFKLGTPFDIVRFLQSPRDVPVKLSAHTL